MEQSNWRGLLPLLMGVVLGSAGAGAATMSSPAVDAYNKKTKHIDANSLSARFSTDGLPGELGPITTRLNDLLARLQKAFDRERQFSADLAHELRTPLAELRSLAELEEEKGKLIWSFDIATPGSQDLTEVAVDALSGEVIAVEKETPAQEKKEKRGKTK